MGKPVQAAARVRMGVAGGLAAAVVAMTLTAPGSAEPSAAGSPERTRVILELEQPPALAELDHAGASAAPAHRARASQRAAQRVDALARDHRALVARARAEGVEAALVHDLTSAYNGMVVEAPPGQLAALADLPGVRAVHPDTSYAYTRDHSVPLVGAPEVWELTSPAGEAVTGTGTVVAVIDTGVDYRHPDLGAGFGPDHTVVAGDDFVNDDGDPMDDNGHGTHVAGIVAGDGTTRGVAPDARLTAYKVLNSSGNGQLSDILAGLDAAVDPTNPYRADVVNLSLSGPGDGTDPLSDAAIRAVEAGVVVVGAAGNAGPGPQSVRSPAAAEGVVAVGASASGIRVPRVRMVEPVALDLRGVRFGISADPPASPRRLEVVDVGDGLPGSYDDVDVTGKAVLINQTRPAPELAAHAGKHGAAAAFLYIPDFWGFMPKARPALAPAGPEPAGQPLRADAFRTGLDTGLEDDGRLDELVLMQIPGASAAALQQHLADGPATVEMTAVDATDQLADFSSRGPSGSFTQKPDLVAPGVEILSTLPDAAYGRGSGTSMAAPHVAGAAALLRQLHPQWSAAEISAALASSAQRLDGPAPSEAGAGRLDLPAAVAADVLPEPAAVSFGLADLSGDRIERTRTVTLTNHGAAPASLSLAIDQHGPPGTVTVEPATAELAPGAQREVEIRVTLPTPEADRDVSGWLVVDVAGDPAEASSLSVPFLLAIRHLSVHVTPDPAPAGTETAVYVRSPAVLTAPPTVEVSCPGTAVHRADAAPAGTRIWRATAPVGDAGLCRVRTAAAGDARHGAPTLTGAAGFESAAAPGPGRGTAHWQAIGPNAEAGWLAFGASHNRVAVVPTGSPSVFVSDDRMRSWREIRTMPMAGGTPAGVEVHPHDDATMYVAVNGGGGADPSYRGRTLLTTDGGATWQVLPGPDVRIDEIALSDSGGVLAVADSAGLRVTHDRGATWTQLAGTWSGLRDLHWIGSDLYLATNSGLLVVRDATGPLLGEPEVLVRPGVLGWAGRVAGDEQTIVVSGYPFPQLFASHDGGATFELILSRTGISFQALELVGEDIYALQPGDLWIGSERGAQWESWGDPMPPAVEFDMGHWPGNPDAVYVASSGAGLYAADGPDQHGRVGIPGSQVLALASAEGVGGQTLVAGTTRNSFHTTLPNREAILPGDLEWQSSGGEGMSGAQARFLATSPADPSVVYKVITEPFLTFGIWRSDDGGTTWERLSRPSEVPFALLVHPADPDRVYVSYGSLTGFGLVMTGDGGQTWRKVDQGRIFQALAGDPTDPDRMWAGDHEGLYLSEDGGMSFARVAEVPVTAIAVDPDDPEHLVVGGRGLHISHDGGQTLQPAAHVDLDMWVGDVEFGRGGDRVFAATTAFFDELGVLRNGRGVLASGDGGATWESFDRGLRNRNATSLAISRDGRHLFVGTLGGSVHRVKLRHP